MFASTLIVGATACSSSGSPVHGRRDAGSDAATDGGRESNIDGSSVDDLDGGNGPRCGDEPSLLVNTISSMPMSNRSAVAAALFALDGADLFYVVNWNAGSSGAVGAGTTGTLLHARLPHGKPALLAGVTGGSSLGRPALTLTSDYVLVAEAPAFGQTAGAVMRVPRAGGRGMTLASTSGSAALASDGERVYFSDSEGTKSVPVNGGPVQTLSSATAFSLALVGRTLYLADTAAHTVSVLSIDDGTVTIIGRDQSFPLYPVPCGSGTCWLNGGGLFGGVLVRAGPDGTLHELAKDIDEPLALLFDGEDFFYTGGAGGLALYRVPREGGDSVAVVSSVPGITHLGLDDDCIYFSSFEGIGSVSRKAVDSASADGGVDGGTTAGARR